ncbi:MAG: hypothetical protein AAF549_04460 [Pseudomonadota bacterium]
MDLADKISEAIAGIGIPNEHQQYANYWEFTTFDGEPISSYETQLAGHIAHIDQFEVEKDFQGRSLGPTMLYTMVRHFESEGAKLIQIHKVQGDGLSFWARYAAIGPNGAPAKELYAPPFIKDEFIERFGDPLMQAFITASTDPKEAWYEITHPSSGVSREVIARLNIASYKKTMSMDLNHPVVRSRLGLDNL